MSKLILPNGFSFQPQYPAPIDYQGLGKGTQILFNPGAGSTDLATGRIWAPSSIYTSTVPSKAGKSYKFTAGFDAGYSYTGYPEITSNVGTFFIWMPVVGVADTNGHVYFGASSPNVCGHQIIASGGIYIGTGSGVSSGSLSSWFNSTDRSLVLVSDGTAAGTKAFVDGKDTGFTWTSPPTAWGAGNKNFNLGKYSGGTGFQFDGLISGAGITSAVWGAAEAKAYHESKGNALYKAPARRLWAVGSSSGINLIGSNASQANTSSTGAITQNQVLAGANSSQSNTASTAAVTQTQVLSGANSAQANTASTAAITQTQILAGANSVQSNLGSSGAITLPGALVLIGVNVTQANTCSVGAITNSDIYLPPKNSDFVWLGFASGEC